MNRNFVRHTVIAFACSMALSPSLLLAQPGGRGFGGGGFFGGGGVLGLVTREEVQQELQLVDEQTEKVQAVSEEAREQIGNEMRDMFSQMRDLSDEERRDRFGDIQARMQELNSEMEGKLKKVLLPHQFERLKQIEVQSRIQQRGAEALTSGELAEALDLTDEQQEKLEQRAAEVQQELQEKIAQLQVEARNKMLDVLTPEQRAKLNSLMGDSFALPNAGPGGFQGRGGGRGGFGFGGRGGDRGDRGRNSNQNDR